MPFDILELENLLSTPSLPHAPLGSAELNIPFDIISLLSPATTNGGADEVEEMQAIFDNPETGESHQPSIGTL